MALQSKFTKLESLSFDNRFTRELPADSETQNYTRQVKRACYSLVSPTSVARPELIAYAREVAERLDLDDSVCHANMFAEVFSGNRVLPGMQPYATCYGGHQFGNWAGQLGDGRAINLGEIVNRNGQRSILQLKGAGLTPYSRTADGLAVLRSSIREFLCSEAMHHLGIPTTRALSLVLTGEQVMRDMFYDGNPRMEPGAIVCRVAESFTRFGSFEIFASRGELSELKQLADYTIRVDFPHLGEPSTQVYKQWFEEICRRTAEMLVHWMRVGFVHGVMNTDNMSILGLTIDYGPYGWLEDYDQNWTPNTTDAEGRRYRFGHQPQIALWNLVQLANAIYPLFDSVEPLQNGLDQYSESYERGYRRMMSAKLGLLESTDNSVDELIKELPGLLQLVETDMTLFFRHLASIEVPEAAVADFDDNRLIAPFIEVYYKPEELNDQNKTQIAGWLRRYIVCCLAQARPHHERRKAMHAVNPKYVLRNYLAQLAIDKAYAGDYSMVNEVLDVLRNPYEEQPDKTDFAKKRPDWARHRAGCSMLSCSS